MKKLILLPALVLACAVSFAQKKVPDFGKIDMADLQLKECSFEPGATAMKLFDVSETDFEVSESGSKKMKLERRVRIKIFNENGYKHASVKIPYLNRRNAGKLKEIKGIIYNLNPDQTIRTQKLEKDDFFKETFLKNISIVNFTFPDLKPGSVIEYSYSVVEKDILQPDPWIIQDDIPVAYTENKITVPNRARLMMKTTGMDTLYQQEGRKTHTKQQSVYFLDNIPSFTAEPFMTAPMDNLSKALFMLIPYNFATIWTIGRPETIWSDMGRFLMNSPVFIGQIETIIPETMPLIDSALKLSSKEDRIHFLLDTLRKWVTGKEGQTLYPGNITDAWKTRTANSTEKNLLLLNLLQKADINAYPLLISTRDNGTVTKTFPSVGQLNGVDVLVIEKTNGYVIDANLNQQSFLVPPLNVFGKEGFLLKKSSMEWLLINDYDAAAKQVSSIFSSITGEGKIEGTANIQFFDYAKDFRLDSADDKKSNDNEKFYEKNTLELKILSSERKFEHNYKEPLVETIDFTYTPSSSGDFYFVTPNFFFPWKKNPFIAKKRKFDIDFICRQEIISNFQLELHDSLEVDYLPKSIALTADDSSFYFKRQYAYKNKQIMVTEIFQINEPFLLKENYPAIHEFFAKMYAQIKEEIILKKKK